MKIKENKILPPKGFTAINLFGIIFVKHGTRLSEQSSRHEMIHTLQMKYMLYVFFYIWYGIEWMIKLIIYRNPLKAYYNISFEREAYENDSDFYYLQTRKPYAWIYYLKNKKSIFH